MGKQRGDVIGQRRRGVADNTGKIHLRIGGERDDDALRHIRRLRFGDGQQRRRFQPGSEPVENCLRLRHLHPHIGTATLAQQIEQAVINTGAVNQTLQNQRVMAQFGESDAGGRGAGEQTAVQHRHRRRGGQGVQRKRCGGCGF